MTNNRRDISEEVVTFYSAKEVADKLGISPVTLKKHSLVIEKLSEGGVSYDRNDNRSRIYTDQNVQLIKRTLDTREKENTTYENAVIKVLQEEDILKVPEDSNDRSPAVPSEYDVNRTHEAFLSVLNKQNEHIERLMTMNEELVKENQNLSENIKDLFEKFNYEEQKKLDTSKNKKWWQFK